MGDANLYVLSGRLGMGWVLAPAAGVVAACIMGISYGYANVYNPFIYVRWLAAFFFGAVLGFAVARAAVFAKCRSTPFVTLTGALAGLAGLYVAWSAFLFVLFEKWGMTHYPDPDTGLTIRFTVMDCLADPFWVARTISWLSGVGWFSFGGGLNNPAVSGIVLWILWIAEALLIVAAAAMWAKYDFGGRVFCEACGCWCTKETDVARCEPTYKPKVIEGLQAGDLSVLLNEPVPIFGAKEYLRVDQYLCPKCRNMGTIKVVRFSKFLNDQGKEVIECKDVCQHVLLTPESVTHLGQLIARGKELKPARKPAANAQGKQPEAERPPEA